MTRTILITGATSGIGLALAHRLRDDRLILVGRRPRQELDDPIFTAENYCQCDLGESGAAATIAAWCGDRGIDSLDVLVNNAGVGWTGPLWEQPAPSIREMVAVNLSAPITITQQLLPLVRNTSGRVVFVSSVVSTVASPDMGVYVATKKALDGFVRSLRAERSAGGVSFQVVHPGATNTAMPAKVGVPAPTYEKWPTARSVADGIVNSLELTNSSRAIGTPNRLLRGASQLAPGAVARVARRRRTPLRGLASPGAVPRALITGAADGIGRALALRYATDGYAVVGVDIDEALSAEAIELAAPRNLTMRHIDLRTSDMSWVHDEAPFDVVVHNAGISAVGAFETINPGAHERVIELNLLAPLLLTRELLAAGKLTSNSRIVLMSSLSHQMGYPGAAVYAATKDGLEMYGRALRAAVHPAIAVTTVFPGPTRTAHARRHSPDNANEARRMDPSDLANTIVDSRLARLIPGPGSKASAALGRVAPRAAEALMRKLVFDKMAELS